MSPCYASAGLPWIAAGAYSKLQLFSLVTFPANPVVCEHLQQLPKECVGPPKGEITIIFTAGNLVRDEVSVGMSKRRTLICTMYLLVF